MNRLHSSVRPVLAMSRLTSGIVACNALADGAISKRSTSPRQRRQGAAIFDPVESAYDDRAPFVTRAAHYQAPEAVEERASTGLEISVALSFDRMTIYFSSNRPGGLGNTDVYTAHRSSMSDTWQDIHAVPNVNTPDAELVSWISPDDCVIYMSRFASGAASDVYIATRGQ